MTLVLELPPELEKRLSQEAERQGITNTAYALQLLTRHLVATDEEFKKATDYVLNKNADLYRRLAK